MNARDLAAVKAAVVRVLSDALHPGDYDSDALADAVVALLGPPEEAEPLPPVRDDGYDADFDGVHGPDPVDSGYGGDGYQHVGRGA